MKTNQLMDTLVERVVALRPTRSQAERDFALGVYRLLAEDTPVSPERLAESLSWSVADVGRMLGTWPALMQTDDDGAIVGFGGLTQIPTKHKLEVGGRTLYTWCAWDSLFIPAILSRPALVESSCPVTGTTIRLTTSANGATTVEPPGVVVSFPIPDLEKMRDDVRANFCELVFFFASHDVGEGWIRDHEGTFLLTLDEAVEVGRQKNVAQFGDLLAT